MRVRVLALAAGGAVALGSLLPGAGGGSVSSVDATPRLAGTPRIQIEHEVVRIPVTEVNTVAPEPAEPSSPRTAPTRAPGSRWLLRSGARRADPPRGVVQRAVRTIVGDGRYKPQPFPTPPR